MAVVIPSRPATFAAHYDSPPQHSDGTAVQSWITRAANLVLVVSQVRAGARLARQGDTDEHMLLLPPGVRAQVGSNAGSVDAAGDSLTIVPPGDSQISLLDDGIVTRIFTTAATDLLALASNAATYAGGAPEVAPLPPLQAPPGGWRLRHYPLAGYSNPKFFTRAFRSARLMVNVFDPMTAPRDTHKLTPHSHDDAEQVSLALEGRWVHHLRTPWSADLDRWLDDQHVELGSPSATVIPAGMVHTSRNVNAGHAWLVDVFAPPRPDLMNMPGMVRNAADYAPATAPPPAAESQRA